MIWLWLAAVRECVSPRPGKKKAAKKQTQGQGSLSASVLRAPLAVLKLSVIAAIVTAGGFLFAVVRAQAALRLLRAGIFWWLWWFRCSCVLNVILGVALQFTQ